MTKSLLATAAAAILFGGTASAAPLTFDVDSPFAGGGVFGSITGTIGGVGFTMTGATVNDDLSVSGSANVGFDAANNGFGVAGVSGAATANNVGTPGAATDVTIDGIDQDENERLRIVFDTAVTISGLFFNDLDSFDDVALVIDGGPTRRFELSGSSFPSDNAALDLGSVVLTGTTLDIIAGFPNPDTGFGGLNDLVQLSGAHVAPVPVPAALPLLGAGLGLLGWLGRRRRAA